MSEKKINLLNLDRKGLRALFSEMGEKPFRADQLMKWIYHFGVSDFEEMNNINKALRAKLAAKCEIVAPEIASYQKSNDGTIKFAIDVGQGQEVETVYIPEEDRATLCVSSQVGCSLDCKFCATSRLKRMRNLNPDEIYDQVVAIDKQSKLYHNRPLSNIVFMGMGEPLMNYNNVLKAIDKITSKEGLGMSPKRIVVSTSGVPKMIKKMADDQVKFNLAVSLHSAIDSVRTSIMPFNETFPLKDLREALQHWYAATNRIITYEYVVWEGINDTKTDIEALIKFCQFAPSKVNLIEYNPIDDGVFQQASTAAIDLYVSMLEAKNITVTVRRSRGKDIDAACGQLANKA